MPEQAPVRLSIRRDDGVLWIGLNRPDHLNAIDEQLVVEFHALLDEAESKPTALIVHSSTPGIFAAGADIAELRARTSADAMRAINAGLFNRISDFPWPTLALIDGPALGGGCELALACDFRFASERSTFGQPEVSLGIIAGAGANWRLPALVGLSAARRLLLLGERLDASTALEIKLVDKVCDSVELEEAAESWCIQVRRGSWQALAHTKRALAQSGVNTTAIDLVAQAELFDSDEKHLRMQRFLDRRSSKPDERT